MSTTDELLTVEDVARVCRIHEVTVRRHIASGRLPSVRVGRGVRVRREDLDVYLEPREASIDDRGNPVIRPFTEDNPLWEIVGAFEGDDSGVSSNKRQALADAYYPEP